MILQKMGFQAGQHEVLSESFSKIIPREIENKVNQVNESTQKNLKEVKKITENLGRLHQNLDKAKKKYKKTFIEWEEAKASYLKADLNPTISRNEIAKLKCVSDSLNIRCEDQKGVYTPVSC